MKIAIVHDWLVTYAGAERVLAEMIQCYPDADIFAVIDFLKPEDRQFLNGKKVQTTWLQNLPGAQANYQRYLPLMPWAMKSLKLKNYDIVISSSHAVAKGVQLTSNQLHVCMCYTPMRYAWDLREAYLKEAGLNTGLKGWLAHAVLERLRQWDFQTAQKVHQFIAISHYIADRIERCYGRSAVVVYPPVDVDSFSIKTEAPQNYFITASRLVPYKNVALIVKAFSQMPDKRLKVVGTGSEFQNCELFAGPNVEMLGFLPHAALKSEIQNAKAFVFAADEDFGIAPLEAQACGTPVIAYGKGGALETVRVQEQSTGLFFQTQTVEAIVQAVKHFEQKTFLSEDCRENALRFSVPNFHTHFMKSIEVFWREFQVTLKQRDTGALA